MPKTHPWPNEILCVCFSERLRAGYMSVKWRKRSRPGRSMRAPCHPDRPLVWLREYRSTPKLWNADRVHTFAFRYLLISMIRYQSCFCFFRASGRHMEKFSVSVNIAPQSHVTFTLTYEELLQRHLGSYEIMIGVRPKQLVQNFEVHH